MKYCNNNTSFSVMIFKFFTRTSTWFFMFLLYIAAGFFYFCLFAGKPMGYYEAGYFFAITLSTIGFGDVVPAEGRDRIFTVIYFCVGYPMFYSLMVDFLVQKAMNRIFGSCFQRPPLSYQHDGEVIKEYFLNLFWVVLTISLIHVVVGAFFWALINITYSDAMFLVFQVVSTIGYGNIRLRSLGRLIVTVVVPLHIVGSLCFTAISRIGKHARMALEERNRLLQEQQLNEERAEEAQQSAASATRELESGLSTSSDLPSFSSPTTTSRSAAFTTGSSVVLVNSAESVETIVSAQTPLGIYNSDMPSPAAFSSSKKMGKRTLPMKGLKTKKPKPAHDLGGDGPL